MSENSRMKFAAEIIGLVAIVASLVFVGIEIRQNTIATRSATIQAISEQAMYLTISMATDEHLPRLVEDMAHNGVVEADLSGEDSRRLRLVVVAGLRRQENLYKQVQAGLLERQSLENVSFGFYRNQFVRDIWATQREFFDSEFALYWDKVLSSD